MRFQGFHDWFHRWECRWSILVFLVRNIFGLNPITLNIDESQIFMTSDRIKRAFEEWVDDNEWRGKIRFWRNARRISILAANEVPTFTLDQRDSQFDYPHRTAVGAHFQIVAPDNSLCVLAFFIASWLPTAAHYPSHQWIIRVFAMMRFFLWVPFSLNFHRSKLDLVIAKSRAAFFFLI